MPPRFTSDQVEPVRAPEGVTSIEPQLAARGLTVSVDLNGTAITLPKLPFRMGAAAVPRTERGPGLGEHTEQLVGPRAKL